LRDEHEWVRGPAADALGWIGQQQDQMDIVDHLLQCLHDPSDLVQTFAADSLGRIDSISRAEMVREVINCVDEEDSKAPLGVIAISDGFSRTVQRLQSVRARSAEMVRSGDETTQGGI